MPSLTRKEKITCEDCGTQTKRNNIVRQMESCSAGTLYCAHCPNFSTKSPNDLNYHIANTVPQNLKSTSNVNFALKSFQGIYALRQHRNTQHGMQIRSGSRDVDVEHIVGDVEDHRLREKLRSCQHFLVGSKLE